MLDRVSVAIKLSNLCSDNFAVVTSEYRAGNAQRFLKPIRLTIE